MSIADQEKLVRDLLKEMPEATIADYWPFLEEVEQSISRVQKASQRLEMKAARVLKDFPNLVKAHENLGF